MSYRVLARTYRSNTFDEVVGQDVLATTLKNAIESNRVHHGYLFTGTRGVGKTSMARILAKALNCLESDAPTTTPCCRCDSCTAVAVGDDVDVVEIDAASNNGVENIRDLRGNANLRPARSRFKIYIIDEVHMLSTAAFNALLKTLEEPPSHVKFILATTEAQKVPETIQSRCQRFDFRAIDMASITKHLQRIVDAERISADHGVLRRISRLARGSMRDALSLLDKLLSYDASSVTLEVANEIIPPPHDELAFALVACVAEQDAAGALHALDGALQSGRTVDRFCDHLIEHLRTLMLIRVCGADTDVVDVNESMRSEIARQAERFDAPTFVYMITLLEELRRNVKTSGAARALADAAVVRLAMSRQFTDIRGLIERLNEDATDDTPGETETSPQKKKQTPSAVATNGETGQETDYPVSPGSGAAATQHQRPNDNRTPPPRKLSTAEWNRVAMDPLVEKIREAVSGKLMDVRSLAGLEKASASNDDPNT